MPVLALAGTPRAISVTVTSTSGALSRKISRHEPAAINTPPMNGPITPTIELSAVHVPIALARSSSGNTWMITANAVGVTSAAHTPCIERNAHSSGIDDATAQRAEVSPNPATPTKNTRF